MSDGQKLIFHNRKDDLLPLVGKTGIYYLIHENNIVYIGSSTTIGNRIKRHKKGGSGKYKRFDSFCYFECKKESLLKLEAIEIYRHVPMHNKVLPICSFNTNDEYRLKHNARYIL